MSVLATIQAQIVAILTADPVFAACALVPVDKGDVERRLEEALAAAGTSILIAPPSARFNPNGGQGPVSTDGGIRTVVQIIETPGVGRPAGIPSALVLAERAGWLIHSANAPDRKDAVPLGLEDIAGQPDPDAFIMQLIFVCTAALDPPDAANITP